MNELKETVGDQRLRQETIQLEREKFEKWFIEEFGASELDYNFGATGMCLKTWLASKGLKE